MIVRRLRLASQRFAVRQEAGERPGRAYRQRGHACRPSSHSEHASKREMLPEPHFGQSSEPFPPHGLQRAFPPSQSAQSTILNNGVFRPLPRRHPTCLRTSPSPSHAAHRRWPWPKQARQRIRPWMQSAQSNDAFAFCRPSQCADDAARAVADRAGPRLEAVNALRGAVHRPPVVAIGIWVVIGAPLWPAPVSDPVRGRIGNHNRRAALRPDRKQRLRWRGLCEQGAADEDARDRDRQRATIAHNGTALGSCVTGVRRGWRVGSIGLHPGAAAAPGATIGAPQTVQ